MLLVLEVVVTKCVIFRVEVVVRKISFVLTLSFIVVIFDVLLGELFKGTKIVV